MSLQIESGNNNVIVDSEITREEALRQNSEMICPQEILDNQSLLNVEYFDFHGNLHQGQIVVDKN